MQGNGREETDFFLRFFARPHENPGNGLDKFNKNVYNIIICIVGVCCLVLWARLPPPKDRQLSRLSDIFENFQIQKRKKEVLYG